MLRRTYNGPVFAHMLTGMGQTQLFAGGPIAVIDYRCEATPNEKPFVERHERYSLSHVRQGSFGVRARGEQFEHMRMMMEQGSNAIRSTLERAATRK